jgi:hypothetical protein
MLFVQHVTFAPAEQGSINKYIAHPLLFHIETLKLPLFMSIEALISTTCLRCSLFYKYETVCAISEHWKDSSNNTCGYKLTAYKAEPGILKACKESREVAIDILSIRIPSLNRNIEIRFNPKHDTVGLIGFDYILGDVFNHGTSPSPSFNKIERLAINIESLWFHREMAFDMVLPLQGFEDACVIVWEGSEVGRSSMKENSLIRRSQYSFAPDATMGLDQTCGLLNCSIIERITRIGDVN